MDPSELHWLTNSSFSPPLTGRWDYQFQSDRLLHGLHQVPIYGSSLSSCSKRSRRRLINDQYTSHHHSASDRGLSYYGNSSENFWPSQWIPSARRSDFRELSTSVRGSRPEISLFSESSESCHAAGIYSVSNSIESASPPSESGEWRSTDKHAGEFSHNTTGRRSFMSTPVYPLVFQNPISDSGACLITETSGGWSTDIENRDSPMWSEHAARPEIKFNRALSELQKVDASPDLSSSSKRDRFRWSSASSYNIGFEGDIADAMEHINPVNLRSANNSARDQKCGLCGRLLSHRSPWSSHRIVRNGDLPVAGILSCGHVFHVECLAETTPKTELNEPPCPVCLKAASPEESTPFPEPLHVALRSARKRQVAAAMENIQTNGNLCAENRDDDARGDRSLSMLRQRGSSLVKNHFKRHFTLKGGKMGKNLFGSNCLQR